MHDYIILNKNNKRNENIFRLVLKIEYHRMSTPSVITQYMQPDIVRRTCLTELIYTHFIRLNEANAHTWARVLV